MKIALGIVCTDELNFLKRHVPSLMPHFDGVFVCDGGSTDGSVEYLKALGVNLSQGDFGRYSTWDEPAHKNTVIKEAEKAGFGWMLSLDADETMFPEEIENAKGFMDSHNQMLVFPRIEFFGDIHHYKHSLYPDYQGRAFPLNRGFYWGKPIHSVLYKGKDELSCWETKKFIIVPNAQIYHYGWALALEHRMKRYYPEQALPDYLHDGAVKEFKGRQPI